MFNTSPFSIYKPFATFCWKWTWPGFHSVHSGEAWQKERTLTAAEVVAALLQSSDEDNGAYRGLDLWIKRKIINFYLKKVPLLLLKENHIFLLYCRTLIFFSFMFNLTGKISIIYPSITFCLSGVGSRWQQANITTLFWNSYMKSILHHIVSSRSSTYTANICAAMTCFGEWSPRGGMLLLHDGWSTECVQHSQALLLLTSHFDMMIWRYHTLSNTTVL